MPPDWSGAFNAAASGREAVVSGSERQLNVENMRMLAGTRVVKQWGINKEVV